MRSSLRIALAALLLAGMGACSTNELSRDEFIDELESSEPAVDPKISSCAYDEISEDQDILDDLADHGIGSEEISVDTNTELEQIMARCILSVNEENESDPDSAEDS